MLVHKHYASVVSPRDIISSGLCIGCGSCVAQAEHAGPAMKLDRYGQFKPSGPAEWMSNPSVHFTRTCPFSPLAKNEDELALDCFPTVQYHDSYIGRFQACYV